MHVDRHVVRGLVVLITPLVAREKSERSALTLAVTWYSPEFPSGRLRAIRGYAGSTLIVACGLSGTENGSTGRWRSIPDGRGSEQEAIKFTREKGIRTGVTERVEARGIACREPSS